MSNRENEKAPLYCVPDHRKAGDAMLHSSARHAPLKSPVVT
jgi:hypothetical protein